MKDSKYLFNTGLFYLLVYVNILEKKKFIIINGGKQNEENKLKNFRVNFPRDKNVTVFRMLISCKVLTEI